MGLKIFCMLYTLMILKIKLSSDLMPTCIFEGFISPYNYVVGSVLFTIILPNWRSTAIFFVNE